MQEKVQKSEQEWREELTPEQYAVLRGKGTEAPFTGRYVHTKDDGVYRCGACGAELFGSDTKFDSGSGWPSFTEPANTAHVTLIEDRSHGMLRTEVRCATCDGHLGHGGIGDERRRQAQQGRVVALDESHERPLVAGLEPGHQLGVGGHIRGRGHAPNVITRAGAPGSRRRS